MERRRREAVRLVQQGLSQAEAARRVHTTRKSVCCWWHAYQQGGDAALAAKPPPRKPCRLNPEQKQDLVTRLLQGARAEGFDTDLWTSPRITAFIRRRYGVRYHSHHIPHLLHALGFTCQKPERRAAERDEAAIRRWIAVDWPRIKKSPSPSRPPRLH